PPPTLFPYTTLFRSDRTRAPSRAGRSSAARPPAPILLGGPVRRGLDGSTRLSAAWQMPAPDLSSSSSGRIPATSSRPIRARGGPAASVQPPELPHHAPGGAGHEAAGRDPRDRCADPVEPAGHEHTAAASVGVEGGPHGLLRAQLARHVEIGVREPGRALKAALHVTRAEGHHGHAGPPELFGECLRDPPNEALGGRIHR